MVKCKHTCEEEMCSGLIHLDAQFFSKLVPNHISCPFGWGGGGVSEKKKGIMILHMLDCLSNRKEEQKKICWSESYQLWNMMIATELDFLQLPKIA